MNSISGAKVAIASEFLNAFASIPKKQQGKVLEFITKFRSNPMAPGINYEKVSKFKDQSLRSVRIDQSYRGIVKKPDSGNVFMLLWVDNHDKAYRWAENKICNIHPETGSLQIFEVEDVPESEPQAAGSQEKEEEKNLYAGIRDRELLQLGVPEALLPLVRSIKTDEQLDNASQKLPQEAYEALFFLAAGYSLEEVFSEMDKLDVSGEIDTNDFESALSKPDTKRRFFVIEDDLELASILNAPLEQWRVFLHPSQRKLVEKEWNGPVRVLGGAGTGKTVVAMHRARYLAQHIFNKENDRILFTTFTKNLAADIRENLSKICPDKAMRRIEVVNLDRWVSEFLHRSGYTYEIDYGKRTSPLWQKALDMMPAELGLDETFYREEWERVIQPKEIETLNDYLKASRLGRGLRLSRKMRKDVWPVFEEYRVLLNENGLKESDDAMRDARQLLGVKGEVLPYRSVIVDEAQDMGPQAFSLIRQMISEDGPSNDIFIVGDAHQRIYRHKIILSRCGINIRGRSRKLRINYRTTDETRSWAVNLLKGIQIDDLDGGLDDQKGYKSLLHGIEPQIKTFQTFSEEINFIIDYLIKIKNEENSIKGSCLVVRTNRLLNQYENALHEKGLETFRIRRSEPEDRTAPGVRLATMHRVKGLEFDYIIIASINEGVLPFDNSNLSSSDPVVQIESEVHERALLYVSATRAKKGVLVTSFGKPSKFL